MKRLLTALFLLLAFFRCAGREPVVRGALGELSVELSLPAGFNPQTDSCRLCIIMHGFWANKNYAPIPHLARFYRKRGFATLRFDFGGCGKSEGASTDMTVETEIADARAIYDYARSLPFVSGISFAGHSQGAMVAGILAGRLEAEGLPVESLTLLAPAAVIPDYARAGQFFGVTCDPVSPPESVSIYGYRIGRKYILEAQQLRPYEETALYSGPVSIIHGTADTVVPVEYGMRYAEVLSGGTFCPIPGETHFFLSACKLDRVLAGILGE
ncbi:MAG: alpha/beta fold hydrolase [Bacteroidales bacterium]|nr:alpha/beta fold hydrolase [Bacteroidales bacterium]